MRYLSNGAAEIPQLRNQLLRLDARKVQRHVEGALMAVAIDEGSRPSFGRHSVLTSIKSVLADSRKAVVAICAIRESQLIRGPTWGSNSPNRALQHCRPIDKMPLH